MKKKLKKRERGRIALLLVMVVALLVAAAVLLLHNLKPTRPENKPMPQSGRSQNLLRTSFASQSPVAQLSAADSFLLVSWPGYFSFYYA